MNFRITDTRNGRSIHTFELKDPPTDEYLEKLKYKLGLRFNAPTSVLELSEYRPWKRRKR